MKSFFFVLMLLVFTTIARADYSGVATARNLYSSVNVGTVSWVEVTPSLPATVYKTVIFDSSGQVMQLGIGAAGHETQLFIVPPGGDEFPVTIPSGSRISIRALSATASSGEYDINFFH